MKARIIVLALTVVAISFSCKKKDNAGNNIPSSTQDAAELLMDSVYLYSKEVYFWNDRIPSYDQFNPRQYKGSSELNSAENVMEAIRNLQPLDRYSFVTTKEESDAIQTGENKDFGFFLKSASIDVVAPLDSIYWFVNYVYDQSTAGVAGVERGWIINKVNGTQLGYDDASVNILNNTFFGSTTTANFEFIKPGNITATASLSKTSFTANSVLYKNILTSGGHKVGYLVFNQFFGAPSRVELGNAFANFQSQGITELIVDLRYNPGGSTETQDTLANLIAPLAANNQKMYTYEFNPQLQQGNFPLLKKKPEFQNVSFAESVNTVNYEKAGTLNLSRVFFIVTGSSASACELIINNLKPYMDVKLIGDTTYGKPVGFFPIEISKYAIYPVSFRTINSAGNADYYNGFAPDKLSPDGVNKAWGDITEPSLAAALNYINSGTFGRAEENRQMKLRMDAQQLTKPVQKKLESNKFTGMYKED
ncbi:MAG TPA: S41 family peptidase [Chitinophagaceae bacterium]|nr:S41 family peptidase [Chitinophagaceae bacterium]